MTTALYRRYRPETFADVIGQEHVTEPLMAALRADRVTHAYLFSGPRGCGKTTSARILARCLNCVDGPTDTPCGICPSCLELARGGTGSLDVVEIDAASHNGVDDARELRERAAFAPARDRYKIFILDEAHMVTAQGFNALLKLVEEPPEHVKFVFATTEPDKVIGTIRSRTHHYPFRLVPPERLQAYLEQLCTTEGVRVDPGVLPLVVRAGGGSVRDTLSVLDQLIAGAHEGELDYPRAIALLGYTDAALLDDVVDAVAARDGASVFRVVDRVIESGHDPRRFVEDLLQRLRDVVVLAMAGDHAAAALRGVPSDQLERMRAQAQHLGAGQASRAADLVNDALGEMGGATSPRLHLELLCARLLLPAADDGARGFGARLDRLEHHARTGTAAPTSGEAASEGTATDRPVAATGRPTARGPVASVDPAAGTPPTTSAPAEDPSADEVPTELTTEPPTGSTRSDHPAPSAVEEAGHAPGQDAGHPPAEEPATSPGDGPGAPTSASATGDGRPESPRTRPAEHPRGSGTGNRPGQDRDGVDVEMIRRRWPEVIATLSRLKRTTWALVSQYAQVGGVSGGVLRLSFTSAGLASTFRSGPHTEPVQQALAETLGVQLRVEAGVDEGGTGSAGGPGAPGSGPGAGRSPGRGEQGGHRNSNPGGAPTTGTSGARDGAAADPVAAARDSWGRPPAARDTPASPAAATPEVVARPAAADPAPPQVADAEMPDGVAPEGATADVATASEHQRPSSRAEQDDERAGADRGPPVAPADDTPSMDDPDAEGSGMVGVPLVAKVLGGTVIEDGPVPAPGADGP
ncbi:DNA polymerase III subunit gamma and tau [Georgenia sp. 10Sc9-8]|uniref:DNA-directed DNA polymerase n=1 Tax=Georgenia halotolerans TaxID=3028317 RepID=A0ABT5U209_9MICO|nr:DNA polymerase III subunit gamma and tau [Georgenia halotolerans]